MCVSRQQEQQPLVTKCREHFHAHCSCCCNEVYRWPLEHGGELEQTIEQTAKEGKVSDFCVFVVPSYQKRWCRFGSTDRVLISTLFPFSLLPQSLLQQQPSPTPRSRSKEDSTRKEKKAVNRFAKQMIDHHDIYISEAAAAVLFSLSRERLRTLKNGTDVRQLDYLSFSLSICTSIQLSTVQVHCHCTVHTCQVPKTSECKSWPVVTLVVGDSKTQWVS